MKRVPPPVQLPCLLQHPPTLHESHPSPLQTLRPLQHPPICRDGLVHQAARVPNERAGIGRGAVPIGHKLDAQRHLAGGNGQLWAAPGGAAFMVACKGGTTVRQRQLRAAEYNSAGLTGSWQLNPNITEVDAVDIRHTKCVRQAWKVVTAAPATGTKQGRARARAGGTPALVWQAPACLFPR